MKKVILLISLSFSISSYAQFTPAEQINSVVDQLENSISNILNEIDYVASNQTFEIKTHLMILSDQLDYIVGRNIDKTFKELNSTQQQLLNDMKLLLDDMQNKADFTLNKVEQLTNKFTALAGTLPFSKKAPIVTGISPSYFHSSDSIATIKIKGAWLSHAGKPYIEIDNKQYFPIGNTENQLTFKIPTSFLDNNAEHTLLIKKINLNVFKKRFLGKREIKSSVPVYVLPKHLGRYKLSIKQNALDTIIINKSGSFAHRNGHCSGDRNKVWNFNTTDANWKILPNSAKINSKHVSTKSSFGGIANLSFSGFQVKARVSNNGDCGPRKPFSSSRLYYDARGSVSGSVIWKEYQTKELIQNMGIIAEGNVNWKEDIMFELGKDLNSFVIEIEQFDGRKKILTKSEIEKWYELIFDPISKNLLLKPFDYKKALE